MISSAALITACSFASFLFSPLASLRQLGFALVVGILVDAILVRPLLVPCGHWLLRRTRDALAVRPALHGPHLDCIGAAGIEAAATALSPSGGDPDQVSKTDCRSAGRMPPSLSLSGNAPDRARSKSKRTDREMSSSPTEIISRSRIDAHDLALVQMLGHLDGATG